MKLKILAELDKIESNLGHCVGCGGLAPPWHKTDDGEIRESLALAGIRTIIKDMDAES